MEIDVAIIIEAVHKLPKFTDWTTETWGFRKIHLNSKKDRLLVFRKNHHTKRWDLIECTK